MIDCKFWEGCSAPICPLDKNSVKNCIWYPDEPICRKRLGLDWLKIQKKIAKRITDKDRYFTVKDFIRIKTVRKPRGHNPDIVLNPAD